MSLVKVIGEHQLEFLLKNIEHCKARLNMTELRFCNPLNSAVPLSEFANYYLDEEITNLEWANAKVIQKAGQEIEDGLRTQLLARKHDLNLQVRKCEEKLRKARKYREVRIPDLPSYNAEQYPDPADYIDRIECIMRGKGVRKEKMHRGILVGASPEVSTWYKDLKKADRKEWSKISKLFIKRFSTAYSDHERQKQLELFLPILGTKLSANLLKLEHLAERAKISKDKQGLNIVAVRVNAMLSATEKNILRSATINCSDYVEYLNMAAKYLEDRVITVEKMSCNVCDKGGHTMYTCPQRREYARVMVPVNTRLMGNKRSHTIANNDKMNNTPVDEQAIRRLHNVCYSCGERNHIARNCPQLREDVKLRLAEIAKDCLDNGDSDADYETY